jgi:hypothetical protein
METGNELREEGNSRVFIGKLKDFDGADGNRTHFREMQLWRAGQNDHEDDL